MIQFGSTPILGAKGANGKVDPGGERLAAGSRCSDERLARDDLWLQLGNSGSVTLAISALPRSFAARLLSAGTPGEHVLHLGEVESEARAVRYRVAISEESPLEIGIACLPMDSRCAGRVAQIVLLAR
jgi:hypothetical protein